MNAVAYFNPFVPPEWIAAHGLQPLGLPCRAGDEPAVAVRRGVCPVAAATLDVLAGEVPAAAVVLTTTCDQMRYAAAVVQHRGKLPVFLLHVPRTWQSPASRDYYRDELDRLGRFLVNCGGVAPDDYILVKTVLHYDRSRQEQRLRRQEIAQAQHLAQRDEYALALVGGPMSEGDYRWLATLEERGVRFVLDATESGERTLPAPVDIDRLQSDPRDELVRIYFDSIVDVFQRPNDRLYDWLRDTIAARGARGIVVRRHVWCDLWHAELPRLQEKLGLPVLEWDGAGDDPRTRAGAAGRMEAFLEMLP